MSALILGLSIGLAAGVSPGPLTILVVTSTLRSGWRAGALAAAAPLVTDAAVIAATLLVLGQLPGRALGVLGSVGAAYVVWTGIATVREARSATLTADDSGGSTWQALRQAAIVNLLSPNPWLTWATVLGPLVMSTWREGPGSAVLLVAGFYLTLVGAKAAVAVLVAGGRRRLSETGYRLVLTGAGLLLVAAGVALLVEFAPAIT